MRAYRAALLCNRHAKRFEAISNDLRGVEGMAMDSISLIVEMHFSSSKKSTRTKVLVLFAQSKCSARVQTSFSAQQNAIRDRISPRDQNRI
jgi:hypothetical protein